MNAANGTRDRFAAAGTWAPLGLVLLAFAAFLGMRAAVGFGILGEGRYIIASQFVEQNGGKGGPYIECEGTFVNSDGKTSDQLAKMRLPSADESDTIPVHRAPWGTYEALHDSPSVEAGQILIPTLLTTAAAGCFVRAWSFVRRMAGKSAAT